MKNSCRGALATLTGAIVLAAAIVAVGVSTSRMMSNSTAKSRTAPEIIDLRPLDDNRRPAAITDHFDRS